MQKALQRLKILSITAVAIIPTVSLLFVLSKFANELVDIFLAFISIMCLISVLIYNNKAFKSALVLIISLELLENLTLISARFFSVSSVRPTLLIMTTDNFIAVISLCFYAIRRLSNPEDTPVLGNILGFLIFNYIAIYIAIITLFSEIYYLFCSLNASTKTYSHAWLSVYFSVITQTTVGYGDVYPANQFTQSIAAIQALVGAGMLPIFVSILFFSISSSRSKQSDAQR